ncbi:MAG: hypothetical protein Q4B09_05640 [Lachnospiraceae bacterium]|nr:hypothetical protein [Lachnospiraceae bacterium]
MKKAVSFLLIAMALTVTACGSSKSGKTESTISIAEDQTESQAQSGSAEAVIGAEQNSAASTASSIEGIPNPFMEYASIEEAQEEAGFELTAPESIDGYPQKTIQVYENEPKMLEISYRKDEEEICIRKRASEKGDAEDISGIYTEYTKSETYEQNDIFVTMKGDLELYHVATWMDGDFNYSVYTDKGMTQEAMLKFVAEIK